jgi:hypothetical protein
LAQGLKSLGMRANAEAHWLLETPDDKETLFVRDPDKRAGEKLQSPSKKLQVFPNFNATHPFECRLRKTE